jgi:NADH-quinone oxidoreductase subunit L
MTTTDATGVLSLGWLVIAAPLFGAVVLLLGGRRTDKWGHLLGVAMPALSFMVGLLQFIDLVGRDRVDRSVS